MAEENLINGVVITFFSTATAVGKTLISVNMASELAREGYSVCLLDMDLQFGDVSNYLKLNPIYTMADIQRMMQAENSDFKIYEFLTEYEHRGVAFHVLPAPLQLSEAYNIEPEIVESMVRDLQRYYDYIIVDTTSMFSTLNMRLLDLSTIVTFLGIVDFIPTIKNMKIGNDTLRSLGYDSNKIRLVLNRSDAKSQISRADVENLLEERFYHILPNDFRSASTSIKTGVPLVLSPDDSELARALRSLVSLYTNKPVEYESIAEPGDISEEKSGGWLSKLFN